MPSPRVSVVIPALNEEANISLVLGGLPEVDEVIVVDGGSVDDTVAVAREVRPDAVIIRQTRSGKGNALVCGFEACTGDIVITLNADGTTDPGEIPRYVDALLAGAEIAHGSRYRDGGGNLDENGLDRLGNRTLSSLVNLLFGTRFTDLGYGYNAFWRTLLPVLELPEGQPAGRRRDVRVWGDGPEIEPLINIRMAAQGLRVVEVASVGYPRIHGVARRQLANECVRALRTTISEYLRRWKMSRQQTDHNQDRTPSSARHGSTGGVGRGTRRATPTTDEYGSFLPAEPALTGRHAAHRVDPHFDDSHWDDLYRDDEPTPRWRHQPAEDVTPQQTAPRQNDWTHAPNPRQAPPWSRDIETAPIEQGSWRSSSYTAPDVIPGVRRPNPADNSRVAQQRRGPAERRVAQRRQPADTVQPPTTWHPPAPFEPATQRPDLTVLPGGAWPGPTDGDRPRTAHLRAVPGERYGRAAHWD